MGVTGVPAQNQAHYLQSLSQPGAAGPTGKSFNALVRGGNFTLSASNTMAGSTGNTTRGGIPAAFQNSYSNQNQMAQGFGAPTSAAQNPGAFSSLKSDAAFKMWRGGVSGINSERAALGGQSGLGGHRFATKADGGDMVLTVHGLHGKNPRPTRVMTLDADLLMKCNGGSWPHNPADLKRVLEQHPECIQTDMQTNPPQMIKIGGVAPGKRLVVLTGAEAVMGNPPRRAPQSQAVLSNKSAMTPEMQRLVPEQAVMANDGGAAMKAAAQMQSRMMADAMAQRAAQDASERAAADTVARTGASGMAERAAERTVGSGRKPQPLPGLGGALPGAGPG